MKILIVGPAWVGDMVMAQGLFKSLKHIYPDARIDVIAPDWTRPLLERMPEINEAISLPFKHGEFDLLKRFKLGQSLKNKNYDQAYVLPNSWKSAMIPFAAGIPIRVGWLGEMRFGLLNKIYFNPKKYKLMIERFVGLTGKVTTYQNPTLITQNIEIKNAIALCPGAEFGPSKRWPENYYADVANYLLSKNIEVWLMGSAKDQDVTQKINAATHHQCKDFAGKTSLGEAIDLIAQTKYVITNDSGLMHIAAALDRPLIALYGSTDPGFTPPLSDKAKILSIQLDCRPCFERDCPLKHHKCMNDLLPARVIEELKQCGF